MKWGRSEVIRGGIILLLFIYVVFGGLFDKFNSEKGRIENILKGEAYSIEFKDTNISAQGFNQRGVPVLNGTIYPYTVVYVSNHAVNENEIISRLENSGYALKKEYYNSVQEHIYKLDKGQGPYQQHLTCEVRMKMHEEFSISYQYRYKFW